MKRLYTLMLSAVMAAAASAAIPTVKSNVEGELSDLKKTGRIITETVASRQAAKEISSKPRKAASRAATAPATVEDLCSMKWEASYQGLLQGNSGLHTGDAKFVQNGTQLLLTLPDYANNLLILFNEKDCTLGIYSSVNYGQNTQGYDMLLKPLNTKGEPIDGGYYGKFNPETGAFEFPDDFAWGMCAYSGQNLLGYFWGLYDLTIKIPDGDYSIDMSFADGEITADNKWTINYTQGADVAAVKYLVLSTDVDITKYSNYLSTLGAEAKDGSFTVDPINSNNENAKITETDYTGVLVGAFDAEGNLKKTATIGLPVIFDDEQEGWATVGTVSFTDGIFAQYYKDFSYTKEDVIVQAKTDNSPVYRFVNPYADESRFDLAGHTHSMVIDATHPDWVSIPLTFSGLDLAGDGTLAFGSLTIVGYDPENDPGYGGTIKDNIVTFPTRTLIAHEQFYNQPGSWSYANSKEDVTFTLPAITLAVTATDKDGSALADAAIVLDGDTIGTTDAEGVANIELPFSVGYFGEVTLTINGIENTIKLNGAQNELAYAAKDWKSIGKGHWVEGFFTDYTYGWVTENVDNVWEVEIEESTETAGIYRVLPYGDGSIMAGEDYLGEADNENYFIVNATNPDSVYVVGHYTPYGELDFYQNCPEATEDFDADYYDPQYGKFIDGEIFFPIGSFTEIYDGYEYIANADGILMLVMPGVEVKDYQLVATTDLCSDNGKATIKLPTIGTGIAKARTTTVAGHMFEAYMIEGTPVEVDLTAETINHSVANPVGGNTTLVEAIDANGNVRRQQVIYHFNNYDFMGWHNVEGKEAKFIDEALYPFFELEDSKEITCGIQEKDDTPGMYRVVNPYRSHAATLGHEMWHNHYLYIDATDPDFVMLVPSTTGLGTEEVGEFYLTNAGCYYNQLYGKEIAKYEGAGGTMNDGVIEIPDVLAASTNYFGGAWMNCGAITVELVSDGKDGISEISSDSEAEAVYHNLRGQRVARPTAPGFYIRNNTKVYVK